LKNNFKTGISSIHRAGEIIFFAGALLIAFSLPLWNLGMSLGQFVMAGGWLMAGKLKGRLHNAIRQPVFWLLTGLFLVHLTGLWNTEDFKYASKDIRVKLPLLLMPLLFAAGPSLTAEQLRKLFYGLMVGVLLSTGAGMFARWGWMGEPVTNYRQLSIFISHIRLSLLIDVALVMAFYLLSQSKSILQKILFTTFICWCLYFLLLLQSITGIFLLSILLVAGLIYTVLTSTNNIGRSLAGLVLLLFVFSGWKIYDYIFIQSIQEPVIHKEQLRDLTARGNTYKNDWDRKDVEEGRYVWIQYNDLEIDTAWMKRSKQRVWYSDGRGQMQLVTLMRYLTYKGYSKDAAGVEQLSATDVQNIEAGYPTPEYVRGENNILFRFKELGGEYRNYYFNNVSSGHTLAQRLEYWKTAYWIISQHPITGVGTGDVPKAFQEAYESRNSSLTKEWRLRAHNQYLSLGVAFGWPGMLLFIVVLLYTFKISFQRRDLVYFAFLLIAAGSFLNEDTLETQAGVTFYAFLNGMFLFRKEKEF
jgi:hypothetical protein